MTVGKNRVRLAVEHLEDRCTPSAMGGGLADQLPAPDGGPNAAVSSVGAAHEHALPIKVTTNCVVDIRSGTVSTTGFGTGGLGHYTAVGHIDNAVIDLAADRAEYSGTFTVFTANGDLVFLDFTTSWQISTGQGTHAVHVTGGTGRFAGASGDGIENCTITVDLATLTGTCHGEGSGTLILTTPAHDAGSP
jgi:hypothetical protein